ncbi:uncharacterized protein B4U80_09365, partial [Leptotrombidium deliense]
MPKEKKSTSAKLKEIIRENEDFEIDKDCLRCISTTAEEELHNIYLIVDETNDKQQRKILNILVGKLDSTQQKSYLLSCKFLNETNSETVAKEIVNALNLLWKGTLHYDRVLAIITDQAPYMLKTVKDLKKLFFRNVKHITCLAHCLHRVSEVIRDENEAVNQLIADVKRVLEKSAYRKNSFIQIVGKLPPKAITTRW